MGSQILTPNREGAIWARLMEAQTDALSTEVAQHLLSIGFGESDRDRMQQLAERSESGTLTDEEREEFDGYLHVGNLLAVMQSKARIALRQKRSAPKITPKIADVFDAIPDVCPVLPHAVERKIPDRAGFVLEPVGVRRYANLHNGPFADTHILKGLEDAIFILCSDGHGLAY